MSAADQLEWERRWAKPAAAAAFASAFFLIAATIVRQAVALKGNPDDDREFLLAIDESSGGYLVSSGLQALSFLALVGVFLYLGRAVMARRPELPRILLWLGLIGPLLLALAGVLSDLDRLDIADKFLASGAETVERAEDLLDDRSVLSTSLGSAGTLAIAVAFVLFGINAMRVGLLTRFMGIIGAIVGALYVIPLLAGPLVVQLIWLLALGVLFLGHWPGGRGPAWETGEAVEWPSGLARQQVGEGEGAAEAEPPRQGDGAADAPARTRSSRKRKKKRR
ncbi:MAG TPA: DUF4386 family protein [Thermoleophilaceae bacterium]|nr:DUF4386 family protein [Thermoleophilaceae bacterium]